MKKQKLLETVADISYIAGDFNFFSGNSRADISNFILWAEEFEKFNTKTDWNEEDYLFAINNFTLIRLREHSNITTMNL